MRYRIKEYNIGGDTDFSIAGKVSIEDIRLIVNETQKKVICSSMNKSNVACDYVEDLDLTFITFSRSICELQPTDQLTIEIDKGDSISSVESKVEEVGNKIDSIKLPEVDLSGVAKQGENIHATNTAIYESLKSSSGYIKMTNSEYDEFKAHIVEETNNILN